MQTLISVKFPIPAQALEVLLQMRSQNEMMKVELDVKNRQVIITTDLLDFPDYANDWDAEDFEESEFWEGLE